MIVPFQNDANEIQLAAATRELESVNRALQNYGLSLSRQDIQALVVGRVEALETSGRVEFGGGVVRDLMLAFASSPFVSQTSFVATILELQELFYEFKNESLEQITDEDLIGKMRSLFDEFANGEIELLAEALFEGLGRAVREEAAGGEAVTDYASAYGDDASAYGDDAADPVADNAVANGYTLATHRYDVSKWVDETYEPAWEGASWLDE